MKELINVEVAVDFPGKVYLTIFGHKGKWFKKHVIFYEINTLSDLRVGFPRNFIHFSTMWQINGVSNE